MRVGFADCLRYIRCTVSPRSLLTTAVAALLPLLVFGQVASDSLASPAQLLAAHRRMAISKLVDGPQAPLDSTAAFGIRYFPHDSAMAFTALFRSPADSALVNFSTTDGRARAYRPYGQLIFFHAGVPHALTVYEMPGLSAHPVYGDVLFLPFFDESNGETTYGGGRYLDLSRAALETGDFRLDFNRAYNPWCAYDEGYSCPVPPFDNALAFAVHAGEADFVKPAPQPSDMAIRVPSEAIAPLQARGLKPVARSSAPRGLETTTVQRLSAPPVRTDGAR